MMEKY